jgi:hypothetical protein
MNVVRPFVQVALLALPLVAQKSAANEAGFVQTDNVQHLVAADRWLTEDGGLARNGASRARPLVRRPQLAWRIEPERLIGTPRVWGDFVVLGVEAGERRRRIEVRSLSDGSLLGKREVSSTKEIEFTIWNGEILWSYQDDSIERLRFGERGVSLVKRQRLGGDVSGLVHAGKHVYLRMNGTLQCLNARSLKPTWDSKRATHSAITVAGDLVYAIQSDGHTYKVVALDAGTGALVDSSAPFRTRRNVRDGAKVQVAGDHVVVRLGEGNAITSYVAPFALDVLELNRPFRRKPPTPSASTAPHALDHDLQIAGSTLPDGPHLLALKPGTGEGMKLDTCDLHLRLARRPPTLARGAIYFGGCAVETTDFHMLWRVEKVDGRELPASRAIPVGRTLLFYDESQLVALRESSPANPVAADLGKALQAGERTRVEPLVDAALKALDPDLAEDLLERSRALGSDDKWAKQIERRIKAMRRKRMNPKPTRVAKVHEGAAQALAATFDEVVTDVATWSKDRTPLEHRSALRYLLELRPEHPGALDQVRSMLPAGVQASEPFLAIDWLDYVGAAERTKVDVLEASKQDLGRDDLDARTRESKRLLLEWRDRWRKDLKALRTERLLMFTPLTQPGSSAKAMATGELVCDLLESMFAERPKQRTADRPMVVFVYPDRDEYLAESAKAGHPSVGWTAGYYTWQEQPPKSRLFVPSDDTGFQSVLPTLAHELTHHWLMDRCEAYKPNVRGIMFGPRGFWIVEGFASFIGQYEFDFERREARLSKAGQLDDADLVASVDARLLLPWDRLVQTSGAQFQMLKQSERQLDVGSRTRLGRGYQIRGVNLFYAQSAMLARYLYEADGGKHRQALLDYVVAFYQGHADELDFAKAFGVSADQLGPKVLAFARTLVE